jgi:superfamily II DNA or RNA helicase
MDIPTLVSLVGYIYILTSPHKCSNNRRKIGLSTLPHHRLNTYLTSCCDLDELYFEKLYQVRVNSLAELRAIETMLHSHFEPHRRRREWFEIDSPNLIDECIRLSPAFIKECTLDDIQDLQHSDDAVKQENQLMRMQPPNKTNAPEEPAQEEPVPAPEVPAPAPEEPAQEITSYTSGEEYFKHMLKPGQAPRRIQSELFNAFLEKTAILETYKGIVQWPTAVGKTIGMLSLFYISFLRRSSQGKIWRGLLIAPQNDILNTIIEPIKKMEKWGIVVISGHDAQFTDAMRNCPTDKHVLITTTHASLTDRKKWDMLPEIHHCHYDEVQQSTGLQFFGLLMEWIPTFTYFTGTSATPKTCNSDQHARLHQLFGTPLSILHKCEMDDAVRECWIAQPKIIANIVEFSTRIQEFVGIIAQSIAQKRADGKWKKNCGKVMVYLDTIADVQNAVRCALHHFGRTAKIYMAVKRANEHEHEHEHEAADESDIIVDGARSDKQFIEDATDDLPCILFACQRYRQGSDIFGIEMTMVLFNATIAANVLLQILGRCLRKDPEYDNKEGWCVIVKTRGQNDADAPEDVLANILLEFANFMMTTSGSADAISKQKIREFVMQFLVPLRLDSGKDYPIEETIERMQCMYLRKEFASGNKCLREYCNEKGIDSSFEYAELRKKENEMSLPSEIPCRQNETIYMFFHPNEPRIEKSEFTNLLKMHELCTSQKYEAWRNEQHLHATYPSIQHINDGYFGANDTNFNSLLEIKRTVRR